MKAVKDVIPGVLQELQNPKKRAAGRIADKWTSIAGPKLAQHTRPSLGREGRLFVWVDEAALAFEMNQRYRPSLLKRVQAAVGEETVRSIHIRVGQLR